MEVMEVSFVIFRSKVWEKLGWVLSNLCHYKFNKNLTKSS
jgi:hypothetical protein